MVSGNICHCGAPEGLRYTTTGPLLDDGSVGATQKLCWDCWRQWCLATQALANLVILDLLAQD